MSDIGSIPQELSIIDSTITLSDNGGSVTVPSYDDTVVLTHVTSNGSDHSYINQDVTTAAVPVFNNVFSNYEATDNSHLVRLDQMNAAISGLSWQVAVLDQIDFTTEEPTVPAIGDRYINTVSGTSNSTSQTTTIHNIYEWDGSVWADYTPTEGWTVWDEQNDQNYTYNGTEWAEFGSTVSHNNWIARWVSK